MLTQMVLLLLQIAWRKTLIWINHREVVL